MAYIQMTQPETADVALQAEYKAAIKRSGKVFNILKIQSLNPPVLHASIALYMATMHGPSGLSRVERELLATVVSQINDCFY